MVSIKPARGFTFVEMLVTLFVAGLLLTIAVPSFHGMINRGRLKSLSEAVYSDLQYARSEALKGAQGNSRGVTLSFNFADGCYGVVSGIRACDCAAPRGDPDYCAVNGETRIVRLSNYPEALFESETFPDKLTVSGGGQFPSVTVNSMQGRANAGSIMLQNSRDSQIKLRLVVSLLGRMRFCVPEDGSAFPGYSRCD